jgi:uncharacterized membrane protein
VPAAALDATPVDTTVGAAARPPLRAVIRHLSLAILTANVIPGAIFYLTMIAGNIWLALIAALSWCYGAAAWRYSTRRRASVLLWLTIVGLTGKTAFAFATGSTYIYFLQPALTDLLVASAFAGSLLTAQPVVGRLARDFYPVDDELAGRPRVQRLFWHLTLLWAVIVGAKAGLSLYLLNTQSTGDYVAIKSVLNPSLAVAGAALTVWLSVQVARTEGLLGGLRPQAA